MRAPAVGAAENNSTILELRQRLEEAEETLRAIRAGEVDALVVDGAEGGRVYTLQGADHPYRAMIEAMQQGAASLSVDGTVLYCNRSFAEMVGRPHEKVLGAVMHELMPESQRPLFDGMLAQGRSQYSRGEIFLLPPYGPERPVYLAFNPLPLPEALVICMIVTDLTEQKKHQDLQAENRSKDVFLATLSHEMRTPLNAMLGWIGILRRGNCAAPDLKEGLEVIERNARVQAQLIDDVLDVSRIVTGKLRLDVRRCDLGEIVRAAVQAAHPAAQDKGIAIESSIDPSLDRVMCDTSRIQQVVWNLMSNAVKFTRKGGSIRVGLTREGPVARIEVTDTGVGISREFLPHVFDRFRQADGSTRRKYGGLGLGLSIVKQLVELHGGSVDVRSEGEGRGSTFTVTLPIEAACEALMAAPVPASTGTGVPVRLDGVRIVVVDDEADARRLLTRVLGEAGASVTAAGSAAEAIRAVESLRPHVLVSDIAMPEADGYDLIREVRGKGHSVQTLPAVALTAFAGKGYAQTALLAGFQVHVAKPIDPYELIAVVGSLAGRTG
jgi:PAS domain S-box-containing protein